MGYKPNRNTPPMERELLYLLYDLGVKWGFCLPPDDNSWISKKSKWTAIEFAIAVAKAEGFEQDSSWIYKIQTIFQERFGQNKIDNQSFTDRARGIKESW